ncbi:hypothetical protein TSUD_352410 [Trifolium subterraneum]|nr:hypothetical protein TSUD_352410 [Trifolium subterraneum]
MGSQPLGLSSTQAFDVGSIFLKLELFLVCSMICLLVRWPSIVSVACRHFGGRLVSLLCHHRSLSSGGGYAEFWSRVQGLSEMTVE